MSPTRERYFEWILVGLILVMGSLLFYQALPFLNGTLGAITLYILLRRVNVLLAARFSPKLAPWIITIAVTIFVMLPLSIFLWYLIDLVQSVNFDVQVIIKKFTDTIRYLERTTQLQIVSEKSVAFITAKGSAFINMLMSGINNAAINLFTTILLLFFLLAGGTRMERSIARCLPFSDDNKHTIITKVSTIVRSNAIGIPLLALIQGAVATVGYWLCGVNNPIEFGALTGFASMIPIVGSMLVWIPLAFVQYFEQGTMAAVYVAVYGVLIISQCDNVLRMFMQKRMANTHPLITIFGVIAGLPLFGFMGLIFGPLLVAMFLLFLEMFTKQYIVGTTLEQSSSGKVRKHEHRTERHNVDKNKKESATSTPNYLPKKGQAVKSSAPSKEKRALSTNNKATQVTNAPKASKATSNANNLAKATKSAPTTKSESVKGKNKEDFKSAKAEHKQNKREAAKIRAHEEQLAQDRALAHKALSLDNNERQPINLANHIKDDTPGKNLVARAVSQAINSFDKFDDLDNNMAFGGGELFKDDFLTDTTKDNIAKKKSERRNSNQKKDEHRPPKSAKLLKERPHGKKNERVAKGERNNHKKGRRDHLDYQVTRRAHTKEEPMLRTVVSHQYGNFDLNKSSSGLKTQLVSMHTAKGTIRTEQSQPRRRPSKRRPYHH